MAVAVNMRMQRSRGKENNLRGFHGIMLGKINLQLIGFIGIQSAWRTAHFNNPPLQIICDFVLESDWGIYLPLNQLLLKPVASYFAQALAGSGGTAADSGTGHCNSRFKWNNGVKLTRIQPWIWNCRVSVRQMLNKCKWLHGLLAHRRERINTFASSVS